MDKLFVRNKNNDSDEINLLSNCNLCPQECYSNRFSDKLGYCETDAGFNISSICRHLGEEPLISGNKGICNIFFSHCNIQCIYCQNYQISKNNLNEISQHLDLKTIIDTVSRLVNEGCRSVGFVSSSHNSVQIKKIIHEIRSNGLNPIFVLNTNSYEKVETIRNYEGLIDVYLPDFKYSDNSLAKELSRVDKYFEKAVSAIKEMYRQKGLSLPVNSEGYTESGLIIRHLVLPGYVQNSIEVLRTIANEISNSVHISLMSQYTPIPQTVSHPSLSRGLTEEEYSKVVEEMEALGFENGWIQELYSSNNYFPDFNKSHPFE